MKKILLTIALIYSSLSGQSQNSKLPDPEAYFSAVTVSDLDNSVKWYSEMLGFEVIGKQIREDIGIGQVNLKRGNVLIELIKINTSLAPADLLNDRQSNSKLQGFFKFGLMIAEFDNWVSYLKSQNVDFHGRVVDDPTSGKKMVIIKDPDGNRIQLFEK